MSGLPPEPPPDDPQDDDNDADDGGGDDNVILLPSFGAFGLRSVSPDENFPDSPAEGLEDPAGAPGELAPPSSHLMEGAVEAMWTGTVDENWAREHHSLWVEDLAKQDAEAPEGSGTAPAE